METLILFARPPIPGKTKTRLIPALGEVGAARLYEAFLADAARLAHKIRKSRTTVGLAAEWALNRESPQAPLLARWLPGPFLHQIQTGSDLSQRMAVALGRRLTHGGRHAHHSRAVLIGTDFPDLPPEIILEAFTALEKNENAAALGPAKDRGYYLIGLNHLTPGVFTGIEWGGPGVFEAQKKNLEALGYLIHTLPEWGDVEEPGDLENLRTRLGDNPSAAHATRTALGIN